jgi:Ala-tRNA(Pro) deacylase
MKYLGVLPGAVTPLAVINDTEARVAICLDRTLLLGGKIHCHPLVNTMTTGLQPEDLIRFLKSIGHEPRLIDIPERPQG